MSLVLIWYFVYTSYLNLLLTKEFEGSTEYKLLLPKLLTNKSNVLMSI